jgi:hypothetical protein
MEKIIYCPKCGRKAALYDGKSSMTMKIKCRNCSRLVVYDAIKDEVGQENMPERTTGSGLRFY